MRFSTKVAALAAAGLVCLPTIASARAQIRAVGSSTVYPFATAVAERLTRANPSMQPPVIESTGTGAGMKLFCAGVGERFPDIENASRRIKASEVKLCAANGVKEITEIQVGIDGVAFAESKSGQLANLTQRDIYLALAKTPFGKPNKAKTWKDVNPKLPAVKIQVYGPPPTSGTRDALGELLLTPPCEANASMAALKKSDENKFKAICTAVREDGGYIQAGENDNLIVQKIEANPGTVGIFGYSYLEENQDKIKGASVNGIKPTPGAIADGSYPLSRTLFIYVKKGQLGVTKGLQEYVNEFVSDAATGKGGYLQQRGLIPLPPGQHAAQKEVAAKAPPMARPAS